MVLRPGGPQHLQALLPAVRDGTASIASIVEIDWHDGFDRGLVVFDVPSAAFLVARYGRSQSGDVILYRAWPVTSPRPGPAERTRGAPFTRSTSLRDRYPEGAPRRGSSRTRTDRSGRSLCLHGHRDDDRIDPRGIRGRSALADARSLRVSGPSMRICTRRRASARTRGASIARAEASDHGPQSTGGACA